ncbi:MAG: peptidylprolyl isomerase [Clostridiales bacterium]|nr:peptidylprolyl isomerase [Clostridiales bacterium]
MKFKTIFLAAVVAFSALTFTACGSSESQTDETEQTETADETDSEAGEESAELTDEELEYINSIKNYGLPQLEEPEAGETIAVIDTTMGTIKVRFFEDLAPVAVQNFLGLAGEGYYDGVIFHRVINDFMIQSGDPTGTGAGGESYFGEDFGLETTPSLRHFRGALAMANTGAENSNGSQFYIVQQTDIGDDYKAAYTEAFDMQDEEIEEGSGIYMSDIYPTEVLNEYIENGGAPYLDGSYTVFGQVTEGMDVVDAIAAVETDENDKPTEDVIINSVTITEY